MLRVINNYRLKSLKTKFILIYLLNVTDVFFTLMLLRTGKFIEVNGIMRNVIGNEALSLEIKTVIPLILLIIIYLRMKRATEKQLIISNRIVNFCLILYILINVSHFVWIFIYLPLAN